MAESVHEEDARWLKMLPSVSHIGQNLLRWEQRYAKIFSQWWLKTPCCSKVTVGRRIGRENSLPLVWEQWAVTDKRWGQIAAACSQCDHFLQEGEVVRLRPAVGSQTWACDLSHFRYEKKGSFYFFIYFTFFKEMVYRCEWQIVSNWLSLSVYYLGIRVITNNHRDCL